MKSEKEIEDKLEFVDTDLPTKYRNMTYEQGVREALMWVMGELDDEKFTP